MSCLCLVSLAARLMLSGLPGLGGGDSRAFNKADGLFQEQKITEAVEAFQDFLSKHPDSEYIPEAQYKLSALLMVQGKPEDANKAALDLIAKHPKTIWADLLLCCQLTEAQLAELAQGAYEKARKAEDPPQYEWPAKLYGVLATRNPKEYMARYRRGVCLMLAGKLDEATTALKQLVADTDQKGYGQLAELRIRPIEQAPRTLEALRSTPGGYGEDRRHAIVDVCGQFVQKFSTAQEAAMCRRALAEAFVEIGEPARAVPHYRALAADQHDADSDFWLAETLFRSEGLQAALPGYEQFVRNHPDDARASSCTRWREWADRHQAGADALGKLLERLCELVAGSKFEGFKCKVTGESKGSGRLLRGDVRFAADGRSFIELYTLKGGLIWVQSPAGSWVYFSDSPVAAHSVRTDLYARPRISVRPDPASDRMGLSAGLRLLSRRSEEPVFDVAPDAAPQVLVRLSKLGLHLKHDARPGGGRLIIETIRLGEKQPLDAILNVDEQFTPVGATVLRGEGGDRVTFEFTDLAVNAKLTDDDFKFPAKPEVRVEDVPEINFLVVLGRMTRLLGTAIPELEQAIGDLTK